MSIWLPAAQTIAVFLGGFSLLNLLGELRTASFDANLWWIDFRPLPLWLSRLALAVGGMTLLVFGIQPETSRWRRTVTLVVAGTLVVVTLANSVQFWRLVLRREITTACPIPFSLLVSAGLGIVTVAAIRVCHPPAIDVSFKARRRWLRFFTALATCFIVFPLAQMICFGLTDYRRPADAIVVLGAKAHADGTPSRALADRVRMGCQLYREGLAPRIIFSGGPGDGDVHETEAMRRFALTLGVPDEAILLDPHGWNTQLTVEHSSKLLDDLGARRVLAVSHFYHLPRIKLTFARAGRDVFTVPAEQTETLRRLPWYMFREVAALWAYYLHPLAVST
jgi:uncharacterized SAM-binding protein YcdF (DUF218 family)